MEPRYVGIVGAGLGTFVALPLVDYPISAAILGGIPAALGLFLFWFSWEERR